MFQMGTSGAVDNRSASLRATLYGHTLARQQTAETSVGTFSNQQDVLPFLNCRWRKCSRR